MSSITAVDVSNYFTNKAIEGKNPLSVMQALKLTYIAQGFHLSLMDKPFFNEAIQAWKHGPVVVELYRHLKGIKDDRYLVTKKQSIKCKFEEKQIEILKVVFEKYARLGAWNLSEITHRKGTPWKKTYEPNTTTTISEELMKEHFKKIITQKSFVILLSNIQYS